MRFHLRPRPRSPQDGGFTVRGGTDGFHPHGPFIVHQRLCSATVRRVKRLLFSDFAQSSLRSTECYDSRAGNVNRTCSSGLNAQELC